MNLYDLTPADYARARQTLRSFFLREALASGQPSELRALTAAVRDLPDGDLMLGTLAVFLSEDPDDELLKRPAVVEAARSYREGIEDPVTWLGGFNDVLIEQLRALGHDL